MSEVSRDDLCLYFREELREQPNKEAGAIDANRFVARPRCKHPHHDSNCKPEKIGGYGPKCGGEYIKCEVPTFRAQIGL